ncbi:atrial natriuretic peptide receptor 1-like [Paramacrobiotus metropolitanus]|uniref:atrial natriuretic peptide receptor 1-like n=1 Tax=Paramacrobiotus metropolitanus TaxID=2943436 RepID=UPI002445C041|nr:atrial natriuretic peptide receptor 1-like [Paramacrobiotus metropolitanus]
MAAETTIKNGPRMNVFLNEFNSLEPVDFVSELHRLAKVSRIFVLLTHGNQTRSLLVAAHRIGFTKGEFVYISLNPMEHPLHGFYRWQFHDADDEDARNAFKSLFYISSKPMRGPDYAAFEMEIKYNAYKHYNYTYEPEERVSSFTALQHTLIRLLIEIVNETLADGLADFESAKKVMHRAFLPRNVSSVAGDFQFDKGDRTEYSYVILSMEPNSSTFRVVFTYDTTNGTLVPVNGTAISWAYRDSPPQNVPPCGFDGLDGDCEINNDAALRGRIGIYLGIPLTIIIIAAAAYIYFRRNRHKYEDEDSRWYIPLSDLEFNKDEPVDNPAVSASIKIPVVQINTTVSGLHLQALGKTEKKPKKPDAHLVRYKDRTIWDRKVVLSHRFSPSRQQEDCIKKMKMLRSLNVAHFYGFSPEAPPNLLMHVLYEHGSRGNLASLMHNSTVRVDDALRQSVTTDLTNGLQYLHDSPVDHHSSINTYCLIIDSRFVLKIAYYRLDILPQLIPDMNNEEVVQSRFLSYAPERLRGPISHIYQGSKQSDLYSYAYVLLEIFCGISPFQKELALGILSPKDILTRLTRATTTAFRPEIPDTCSAPLTMLIERCWEDRPESRPTIKAVQQFLKTVPGFERNKNFVDSLMHRMEVYARELEDRIGAATANMMEEKRKSEELLFQILPQHLALAMTQGRDIKPETFDSVTIAFTAIADFGEIATGSSPFQIVKLLNDLYSMFDNTLDRYDVYKVETIADSYMIASGVPNRNGQEHARQIARIALDLIKQAKSFLIAHHPGRTLQLKIGCHTGGCAAAIVGTRMPRYCLFGDTVNTASRMTSFGKALKIQISSAAREYLERYFNFKSEYRGQLEVKGKGMQNTYWLISELHKE